MTTPAEIVTLQPDDTEEIAAMTAPVFAFEVPIAWWLVPEDIEKRKRLLREQFALLIRFTFDAGGCVRGIRRDGQLIAAAVWSIHHGGPVTEPPGYDAALQAITGPPYYERFRALDNAFRTTTPEEPHHHLELLAATERGQGLGTWLVTDYLDWADQQRDVELLFLHASSADAARLYARLGFHTEGAAEIEGSDQLFVFPMRRPSPGAISPPHYTAGAHLVRPDGHRWGPPGG